MSLIAVLMGSDNFLFGARKKDLGLKSRTFKSRPHAHAGEKENPSEDSQFKYSHSAESRGSSCIHIANNREQMEQRIMGGFGAEKQSQQSKPQNNNMPFSTLKQNHAVD